MAADRLTPVSRLVRRLFVLLVASCVYADTIAILPLFNQSKSANLDWIGESVAETIRESLFFQGLLVLDREDRLEIYRRLSIRPNAALTHASVLKVAEGLDADQIIFGQFTINGTETAGAPSLSATLELTAQLFDVKHTRSGPEFHESGPLSDLTTMQRKLAWQFLHYLSPNAAPVEGDFLRLHPPVRVDAMENYVRGLLATGADQKQKLFTQAARLDPQFSQPVFQLGRMYVRKKEYSAAAQWLSKVSRADLHYMEAMFLLGLCRYYQGDFAGAARQFQMVAAEVPLNEVYNDLGAAQSRLKLPAAMENFQKALEGDEADPDYWFNLGYALWKKGQFGPAEEKLRAVLDRTPEDTEAKALLSKCLLMEGPRAEPRWEGRERLKHNFEETAFRQLQAELKGRK
jgi:tetratricopeptide (TPR) repeat protein